MIGAGLILGARADIAVQDAQPSLTLFLLAELAEESHAALKRFAKRVADHPAVIEAHYVAGEADVLPSR